jgi:hypothetical protein
VVQETEAAIKKDREKKNGSRVLRFAIIEGEAIKPVSVSDKGLWAIEDLNL